MGRGGVNCRFVAVQEVGMEGMILAANSNVHAKIWPWRLFSRDLNHAGQVIA